MGTKKISAVSKYFESIPYRLNEETGLIDYDECEKFACRIRPKILIAGASAYSRLYDYGRMRQIADKCGAYLLADMAHISGLVASSSVPTPFPYADVVTTTTHKSLRGPRGAMIFYRKGQRGVDKKGNPIMYDLEDKINFAVFPGLQGGPHNHTIGALATCLKQANSAEFVEYQKQVLKNSNALAEALKEKGYELVSGGTENHLLLVDVKKSKGVTGARAERVLELACIATNKNTVPRDTSALNPSGIRMGAPALTSRGFKEADFRKIADFFDRAVDITAQLSQTEEGKKLKGFRQMCSVGPSVHPELEALRLDVQNFASSFATVGFDESDMLYNENYDYADAA